MNYSAGLYIYFPQSSLQKVELEDEVDLVYAVVTLPAGDDTSAYLFFLDDKTGKVLKKTEISTWKQVERTK